MIDFKTLKAQVEDDMARTDADFRYRRWCESNDIAWEEFTSLIIDPSYSVSSLLRVLKANGLDTTDGSLRSLRRRLEEAINES